MLTKHDWDSLNILWPAVLDAQHSEKPSIVALISEAQQDRTKRVRYHCHRGNVRMELAFVGSRSFTSCVFAYPPQQVEIPSSVIDRCRSFWSCDSVLTPIGEFPSNAKIAEGLQLRQEQNKTDLQSYHALVEKICDRLQSGQMLWRHYNMGVRICMPIVGCSVVFV